MNKYMNEALKEAEKAADAGEVPVGAIVVKDDEIISRGHNRTETAKDPTAHGEMEALRSAARELGGWRLAGCDVYVTCEPCSMCAGAMVLARIRRLYIGTMDPKAGACGSVLDIPSCRGLNHHIDVVSGIMEEQCSRLMKDFFRRLRETQKENGGLHR